MPRRAASTLSDLDVNLTSMLDLVFNILAFFVMTFNPPKPDRSYDLSLPPPKAEKVETTEVSDGPPMDIFRDLNITVMARPDGTAGDVRIEGKTVGGGIRGLSRDLRATVGAMNRGVSDEEKVSAATIIAAPGLKYRYLIQAVDACHLAGIKRVNFSEAGAAPAGAAPF